MSKNSLPRSSTLPPEKRLTVGIELTNVCNFRCPICPQAYKAAGEMPAGAPYDRKNGMISREVFLRAVDESQRVARRVELGFFGEQTLHAEYVPFLHELRERTFDLEVNTNLSFLTREMMQAWIDVGLDRARLSVDAITPAVFNRARPGLVRDFEGRNVPEHRRMKVINEKIAYWLSFPEHRPTRLVFVESSYNRGELIPFLEHWLPKLGPEDRVLAKRVLSYGGKIADALVSPHRCNVWEERYVVVDWGGVVSPCNLDTNMDLALGNVMEASLEALYYGERAQALRGQTGCGRAIVPCNTCVDGNNWGFNQTFAKGDALPTAEELATPIALPVLAAAR